MIEDFFCIVPKNKVVFFSWTIKIANMQKNSLKTRENYKTKKKITIIALREEIIHYFL